ncbi:MAG: type IX secretion system membrane protein PorP/SprF, partial [Bacteroidia bacterium]|nr:type IX secretion system membrane protein PorP/SprF [Bacteroidia bacterium]
FSAGLLYRFKDALIPTIELEKSNFAVGMSYDVTLSKLSSGTKYRGGFEIYLRLKALDSYLYKDKEKPGKPDASDGQPKY